MPRAAVGSRCAGREAASWCVRVMRAGAPLRWFALLIGALAPAAHAVEADYVGEKVCITCHALEDRHFSATQHAKVFRLNPRTAQEARGCEACHGPGSRHIGNVTDRTALIGFTRAWNTPLERQNAQCLACHEGGPRIDWPGSAHALHQVACADCHNPMARLSVSGLQRAATISETCLACHAQQRAEFRRRSHMPLPEGQMSCSDCHNPHGTNTRPLLRAESINALCFACHAEKRGPFLWEHAPVRERCTHCHHPHGSNHDKLLVAARPYLCQQCHNTPIGHSGVFYRADQTAAAAARGATQSARVIGRSCSNCHTQIHGSNHPSGARLQR
ncbi:MAG TPA: DmsE family decaheme c-type cytochrome [Burkholderiaceae bacterium]|nr:DmsE family decaheme c-type cytochrome [Burkholderiaceae bacterium]